MQRLRLAALCAGLLLLGIGALILILSSGDGDRAATGPTEPLATTTDEPSQVGAEGLRPASDGSMPAGDSTLLVVLLDSSSGAVSGATVTLVSATRNQREQVTDSSGEAIFAGIGAGSYGLRVETAQRPPLVVRGGATLEEQEVKELVLRLGDFDLLLAGRVRTRNGTGISGIEIEATRRFPPAQGALLVSADESARRAVTDEDGFFEVGGFDGAELIVRTVPTALYPSVSRSVRAGAETVDLVLEPGRLLKVFGRVTDEDGHPLADVVVDTLQQRGLGARTAADGTYAVDLLLPRYRRVHSLRFRRDGYRNFHVQIRDSEVDPTTTERRIDTTLEPAGITAPFTGAIRTPAGAAVSGEVVFLRSPSRRARLEAESDALGRFSFPEVPPAEDYYLSIRPKANFEDLEVSSLAIPREGLDLELTLDPLVKSRLTGQMVDSDGNPVPRLVLELRNTRARSKKIEVQGDDEGFFAVDEVPAGALLLETRSPPRFRVQDVELSPGVEKHVRLVLDSGSHEISGTVTALTGDPISAARVELFWYHMEDGIRSSSHRRTRTNDEGLFTFTGVARGPHKLVVYARGYRRDYTTYDVGAETNPAAIRLSPPSSGEP